MFRIDPELMLISLLGRNALHLAAKYGHALCLQKLLQVLKKQLAPHGFFILEKKKCTLKYSDSKLGYATHLFFFFCVCVK